MKSLKHVGFKSNVFWALLICCSQDHVVALQEVYHSARSVCRPDFPPSGPLSTGWHILDLVMDLCENGSLKELIAQRQGIGMFPCLLLSFVDASILWSDLQTRNALVSSQDKLPRHSRWLSGTFSLVLSRWHMLSIYTLKRSFTAMLNLWSVIILKYQYHLQIRYTLNRPEHLGPLSRTGVYQAQRLRIGKTYRNQHWSACMLIVSLLIPIIDQCLSASRYPLFACPAVAGGTSPSDTMRDSHVHGTRAQSFRKSFRKGSIHCEGGQLGTRGDSIWDVCLFLIEPHWLTLIDVAKVG